jgi:hypothetical protein
MMETPITNNDNPQTAAPSITVTSVHCTSTDHLDIEMIVSRVYHDSHALTYQIQIFSPTGYLLRVLEYTIQPDYPDPTTTNFGLGIPLTPDTPAGTYKIIAIINGQAVSTTFQAPDCSAT